MVGAVPEPPLPSLAASPPFVPLTPLGPAGSHLVEAAVGRVHGIDGAAAVFWQGGPAVPYGRGGVVAFPVGQSVPDVGGNAGCLNRTGVVEDHRKLVAAVAGDETGVAHAAPDGRGDAPEERVAGQMSGAVVDSLQPLDVE